MAQIAFFATDQDLDAIWQFVFAELGMIAFPDPWFGNLPASDLVTSADVAAILKKYPQVAPGLGYFLTSRDWSREPLVYDLSDENPYFTPHWVVRQRYGGPSIHFIPRFGYPCRQKSHQIIAGMFSDYPYYYSALNPRQIIERPDSMVSAMRAIKVGIGAHGGIVRANDGKRAIAMSHALASHQQGATLRQGDLVFTSAGRGRGTRRS